MTTDTAGTSTARRTSKSSNAFTAVLQSLGVEEKLSPIVEKLMPVIHKIGDVINWLAPHLEFAWAKMLELKKRLDPYHPEELVDVFFGLFLVFFGGMYLTLLATIEAYRMCGWTQTKTYLLDLYSDYCVLRDENRKDDQLDDNNDGIADVRQISKKDLATRKVKLVLTKCNPEKVMGALSGLYMGLMAIMATLRLQFAQAVTLGAVIGDMFFKTADKYVTPLMHQFVPSDYHRWIPLVIKYTCRSIAISIAWFIQRVISAFYSAMRGGNLFAKGVFKFASRKGYTAPFDESSIVMSVVGIAMAIPGFYWQISSGFSMPFPLNILLLPVSTVEWWLTWMVNSATEVQAHQAM